MGGLMMFPRIADRISVFTNATDAFCLFGTFPRGCSHHGKRGLPRERARANEPACGTTRNVVLVRECSPGTLFPFATNRWKFRSNRARMLRHDGGGQSWSPSGVDRRGNEAWFRVVFGSSFGNDATRLGTSTTVHPRSEAVCCQECIIISRTPYDSPDHRD
jgi:hypothetical protein